MRKKALISIVGLVFSIGFCVGSMAQTIILDPGTYAGDVYPTAISGYQLDGKGWFWWDNHPSCAGETYFRGKVGYKALRDSPQVRLVSSCQANPNKCTPARDEAYVYYFADPGRGSDVTLYRKSLAADETDPGVPFDANGQTIALDDGESSRLWVEGEYLYYQEQAHSGIGGYRTRLYRVLRDGTAVPEVPLSTSGTHFFTEFESFRYFKSNGGIGAYRTGHLLLTDSGRLYLWDADGLGSLIRLNVFDIEVLPPSGLTKVSTIFTVENTGGEGDAQAKLYSISPISGGETLLTTQNGYHFLKVECANWPNDWPGRIFLHRAIPGFLGSYYTNTCQRQLASGNYNAWDPFLSTAFGGSLTGSREWVYYVHDSKIKGKKSDAPPELIEVEFLGLEVTQGVQSLDHGAIMVEGKTTYARGYARLSINTTPKTHWYTGARLHGSRGGNPLPGSPLSPMEPRQLIDTLTLPDERNNGYAYLFEIPPSWTTAGNTTFELRLNEGGGVPEMGTAANAGAVAVNFVDKQRTCLKLRPLKTVVSPYHANAPGSGVTEILERCESMLPVSGLDAVITNSVLSKPVFYVEVEWHICPVGVCPVPVPKVRYDPFHLHDTSDNDDMWAIFWLGVDRLFGGGPCGDYHVVGTVHPDISNFNGIGGMSDMNLSDLHGDLPSWAIPNTDWTSVLAVTMRPEPAEAILQPGGFPTDVFFNAPYGGRTLAHELGHNYGRRHVDQSGGSCGGSTPDGPYHTPPFDPCTFGVPSDTSAPGSVAGFDVVDLVPVPNHQATIADLMSYGDARWTSVWTWNAIANKIPGASADPPSPAPESESGPWIVVKGFYDTVTGEAFLMPCEILPDGIIPADRVEEFLVAEAEMPDESPFDICQLGCMGAVLATHKAIPFPIPREEGSPPPDQLWFLQVLPCEPDMTSIALCHEDAPVAWLPRSPHFPLITVRDPAHDAGNKLLHLSWDATDPDGSPLLFSVFFSPDNGGSWQPLDANLDTTELTVSTRNLPGGDQARVRVIACDGMDTAIGESAPFELPTSPPEVMIGNPAEGARVPYGQAVKPLIFAYDNEDGLLEPQWSLAGPSSTAGVGNSPCLRRLAPGDYIFSAVASDREGSDTLVQRSFEVLPVEVPDGGAPDLDGYCADASYSDAAKIRFPASEGDVVVHLLHSGGRLYVSLCDIPYADAPAEIAHAGIIIDTDGTANPGEGPGSTERGFYVDENGLPWQTSGDGSAMVMESEPPLGFFATIQRGAETWSAEFGIDDSLVNGWDHAARLALDVGLGAGGSSHIYWPPGTATNDPSTWAEAWFGTLPPQPNQAPTSVVPEQIVVVASQSDSIVLHGGNSTDPDGDSLTFSWSQVSGPAVSLQGADTSDASFAPPGVGDPVLLVFALIVNDGSLPSPPAQTTVVLLPDPPPYVEEGVNGASVIIVDIDYLPASGEVDLLVAGQPGRTYDIQRSVDGLSWSTVGARTAGVMGSFNYAEDVSLLGPVVLYRTREQP